MKNSEHKKNFVCFNLKYKAGFFHKNLATNITKLGQWSTDYWMIANFYLNCHARVTFLNSCKVIIQLDLKVCRNKNKPT